MELVALKIPLAAVAALSLLGIVVILAWRRVRSMLAGADGVDGEPGIPKQTLQLLPEPDQCWWQMDSSSGKPAMRIVTKWQAINICAEPVLPLSGKLLRPKLKAPPMPATVLTKLPGRSMPAQCPIPPGQVTELCMDFSIEPPITAVGQSISIRVSVLDQYENEHRTGKLVLRCRAPAQESEPATAGMISAANALSPAIEGAGSTSRT